MACRLGIAPSTVHRILADAHLNRLSHVDRATGEPIRRYENDHPGAMLHVDMKKLGNIPTAEAGATSADNKARRTAQPPQVSRRTSTTTR